MFGKALFYVALGVVAFAGWSYLMLVLGRLQQRVRDVRNGIMAPRRTKELLTTAGEVIGRIGEVSSVHDSFDILTPESRRAREDWLARYRREVQ